MYRLIGSLVLALVAALVVKAAVAAVAFALTGLGAAVFAVALVGLLLFGHRAGLTR